MVGVEGGDLSFAIRAWFRMARLFADFWIPAFAGMTGVERGNSGGRRGDLSLAIRTWIRAARLVRRLLDSRFRGNGGGRMGDLSLAIRAWFQVAREC